MAEKSAKKSFSKNSKKTIYKIAIVCYNIIIRNKEYKFLGGNKMRTTRHGVIEEVAIMIRTGASEKAVSNFVENVYQNGEVSDRVYCILLDMIIENY